MLATCRKSTKMIKRSSTRMFRKDSFSLDVPSPTSSWRRSDKPKRAARAKNPVSPTVVAVRFVRSRFCSEVRSEPPPGFNPKVVEVYTK